jgi:MFS transporter, FHS family, L-fucose permease
MSRRVKLPQLWKVRERSDTRFVTPSTFLASCAIVNVFVVAFGVLHPGWAGPWALFATSFFMSLMFPTIFALVLKGL